MLWAVLLDLPTYSLTWNVSCCSLFDSRVNLCLGYRSTTVACGSADTETSHVLWSVNTSVLKDAIPYEGLE